MAKERPGPAALVLVGGSAGAHEALKPLLAGFGTADPVAILVTIHIPPVGSGGLEYVLSRWTQLRVVTVTEPQPIAAGCVYVASPDNHLLVTPRGVAPSRGPREHHSRPAIDVMFRTAARHFKGPLVAVVLSGRGSDGVSGAMGVQTRGGHVVVQSPDDATYGSLPQRVVELVSPKYVERTEDLGTRVRSLLKAGEKQMVRHSENIDDVIAKDIGEQESGQRGGQVSVVTCPDCGGALWQSDQKGVVAFACHTGHRWSSDTLLVQKTEALEAALFEAFRMLKEKAIMLRQAATRARAERNLSVASRLEEQALVDERHADVLKSELLEKEPSSLANANVEDDVAVVQTRSRNRKPHRASAPAKSESSRQPRRRSRR